MTALELLIAALATYRLTRLVTVDRITESLRTWAEQRARWAGYLTTCPWCSSWWVGLPVAAVQLTAGEKLIAQVPLVALALSAVAGLLTVIEERLLLLD